jgi:hypothetical protein
MHDVRDCGAEVGFGSTTGLLWLVLFHEIVHTVAVRN